MAAERLAEIAAGAAEHHGSCRVAVEHRVGAVPLSQPSVIVAVSAPHRPEAFAADREIIDAVKQVLNIPPEVRVVALLAIGKRTGNDKLYGGRFHSTKLVFDNQWGNGLEIK